MEEAYPLWRELERASGETLIVETGLLYYGSAHSATLEATRQTLLDHRVEFDEFGPATVGAVFPALCLQPGEVGLLTPEAGWIHAERALQTTLMLAREAGCDTVAEKASRSDIEGYDVAVICAGPWVKQFWPDAPVSVTYQSTAYVARDFSGPVWIEDGEHLLYGFPGNEIGSKIGVHRRGPEVSPDQPHDVAREEDLELIRELSRRRFGLKDVAISQSSGCLYTNTASDDFLIRQLDAKTLIVSACSGHGFKFGPWLGRLVADLVEGREDLATYCRFDA